MLKPHKKLNLNETYTLDSNNTFSVQHGHVREFTVIPTSNLPTPKWQIYPQLTNMEYAKDGGNGSLTFKYKVNIPAEKHLIRVNRKSIRGRTEYIVQPSRGSNDETEFELSFDTCSSDFGFKFNPWQIILMQFDLILENGDIIPWQGHSIAYIIRKKHNQALDYSQPARIPYTYMPSWFDRIKEWLS